MNLDEDDIAQVKKSGARVNGLRPLPEPKPQAEAPMRTLLVALRQMTTAIELAIEKRGEQPTINLQPAVTLNPTFKPEITVEQKGPKVMELEVTERDADKRIKRIRIKVES